MNEEQMAYLSECLIQYHANSFKIRTYGIAKAGGVYALPVAIELRNFRNRLLSDYSDVDLLSQALALRDIMDRGKDKIFDLVKEAEESEDPKEQLAEAKKIRKEMAAAQEMLERLKRNG
jgi:hypothetical protein